MTTQSNTHETMNYALVSGTVVDVGEASKQQQQPRNVELTSIWEQYAQRHVNPRLVEEEYQQRDALLQQVAAQEALNGNPIAPLMKQKKHRGLFRFLQRARQEDDGDGVLYDTSRLDESKWLEYETEVTDSSSSQNTSLCGSTALDTSCIPREAYSAARFHLSCRPSNVPNVARCSSNDGSSNITLVHIGIVCDDSTVKETRDCHALQSMPGGNVSRARAVVLDSTLVAVSWGFSDGLIILYQRHSWNSIAVLSPTRAVSDNIQHDAQDSMVVTDLVVLHVQDPNDASGVVTTLAVSRLGGYIEFIILPHEVWRLQKPRKQKRKRGSEHYAADLPNISFTDTSMTALTTADYHVDVICLEAHRTKVGSDTEWDTAAFPKMPPAEYVVAASGGTKDGRQVISFWGVSIVFSDNSTEESASIHIKFLDGIDLGATGADVTVFASARIWECWRKPRRVRLRPRDESKRLGNDTETNMERTEENESTSPSPALVESDGTPKRSPLSTLSTAMPIVRMRLRSTELPQSQVVLAALDGNGGIAFIDCTTVIAFAAHDITEKELGDQSLLKVMCRMPSSRVSAAVDIGWLRDAMSNRGEAGQNMSPPLSIVAFKPRMLQVISLSSRLSDESESIIARVSYSLDLPSVSHGATIIATDPGQCASFVTLKTTKNRRKLLCRGNLERLDSSTVIVMLVREAKYAEAIDAAQTMHVPSSSDKIQMCYKKLWERDGVFRHLSEVTDDSYVIKETLAIFDGSDTRMGLDLITARAACLLALERASNTEETEEVMLRLEALEAKVSTYILLCMSNDAVPRLGQFRDTFLAVSLQELASTFALKGNIPALTSILFRHRPELLPCQLEILDKLPLETPPDSFAHLLPVSQSGKSCFHTGEHGISGLCQWSLMARYIESTYGNRLILDDKDEAAISDRSRLFDDGENGLPAAAVRRWYTSRAKRVQNEIGSISLLRDFFELASQRLGVSLSSTQEEDMDPELNELRSMYTYATQLSQISSTILSSISGKIETNTLATMPLSEIGKMSADDRVKLILGPPNDPSSVLSKFRSSSMLLALGDEGDREHCERTIDEAVSAYCTRAVLDSVGENRGYGGCGPQAACALRTAVDICTEIANASRSTIRRSNRVIKDKTVLMNLVLNAAYGSSGASKLLDLLPSDGSHILSSIWESYECLPVRFTPDDTLQNEVQKEVDDLYSNLIVVDIFSRWSQAALRYLVDLKIADNEQKDRKRRAEVGLTIMTEICRSFCSQSGRVEGSVVSEEEVCLLRDLLSDIEQLDRVGFDGTLPVTSIVQEYLVKPLLRQEKFHCINSLANWSSREEVQAAVLAFVNEAMFDDVEALSPVDGVLNRDRVQSAIRCQDILGPLLPELRTEFESSRHYLDAAFLINRVAGSNEFINPCELRDKSPIDVVESLMRRNPGCILDGCRDWTDPTFSRKANETICTHYWWLNLESADEASPGRMVSLPVLPGSAIYHLVSLLKLQGPHALLVVKARVVFHAILITEYAAAAAVCATMVYENGPSWEEPAVADCIVDAVARVVSMSDYDDVQMKLALCSAVFQRNRGTLTVLDCQAYETVLDSFVALENLTSRCKQQKESASDSPAAAVGADHARGMGEPPAVNDFLVFRAIGMVAKTAKNVARHAHHPAHQSVSVLPHVALPPTLSERVYQDILAQYSTDINELFWILRGVSASNKVDDPLLLTLGRLLGFWCIADALQMRPQTSPLEPERADLNDVLALGMSLLLHTQDREALASCIGELQGILSRETAATMEGAALAAQPDSVIADPEIVKLLISRGYSENGARRAAIMTGNESAQVALVWAVSHTLDEGFDDPMVTVASSNGPSAPGRVDQNMIHCLKETLNLASGYVSRKRSLQSLLPATKSISKLLASSQTGRLGEDSSLNGHGQKTYAIRDTGKLSSRMTKPISGKVKKCVANGITGSKATGIHGKSDKSQEQPSAMVIDKPAVPMKPAGPLKTTAKPPSDRSSVTASSTGKSKPVVPLRTVPKEGGAKATASPVVGEKVAPTKTAPPSNSKERHAMKPSVDGKPQPVSTVPAKPKLVVPPAAATAPRSQSTPAASFIVPKASASRVDRMSTLRSHDMTKTTGTNLASDERKRLIAEGRRMLREARASRSSAATNKAAPSATAASIASSSRYPLRSLTATASSTATDNEQVPAVEQPQFASAGEAPKSPPTQNEEEEDKGSDGWDFDDF